MQRFISWSLLPSNAGRGRISLIFNFFVYFPMNTTCWCLVTWWLLLILDIINWGDFSSLSHTDFKTEFLRKTMKPFQGIQMRGTSKVYAANTWNYVRQIHCENFSWCRFFRSSPNVLEMKIKFCQLRFYNRINWVKMHSDVRFFSLLVEMQICHRSDNSVLVRTLTLPCVSVNQLKCRNLLAEKSRRLPSENNAGKKSQRNGSNAADKHFRVDKLNVHRKPLAEWNKKGVQCTRETMSGTYSLENLQFSYICVRTSSRRSADPDTM